MAIRTVWAGALLLGCAIATHTAGAQSASAQPSAAQPQAACPSTETLDKLIHALDDVVSGPANKDRACLRALLSPDARLIPVSKKDGVVQPHVLTIDGWIERVKARGDAIFYEKQIQWKSETYGQIAHLFSTYEIRDTPDGKAEMRGINSIQAVNDGKAWRVMEILWQAETADAPIPKQYLP